jgi:ABC-type amino acid transport substrate-binding protein
MSNRFVRLRVLRALVVLAVAGAAGLLDVASGVAADQKAAAVATIKPPAELKVGITTNYPPVAFQENGKVLGIEADLARLLGEQLPTKIEFVQLDWEELWPALRDKKIDVVMSGVSVTQRRSERVTFTQPYLSVGQMALVRKADMGTLSEPNAMNQPGRRIGVERSTTGEAYARHHLDKATVVTFDSIDPGLAALRGGKVDYFIHDAPTVWRVVGRPPKDDPELVGIYRSLTEEDLAWAVRKDDAATLGVLLDGKIAQWRADGELQATIDRWIPITKFTK